MRRVFLRPNPTRRLSTSPGAGGAGGGAPQPIPRGRALLITGVVAVGTGALLLEGPYLAGLRDDSVTVAAWTWAKQRYSQFDQKEQRSDKVVVPKSLEAGITVLSSSSSSSSSTVEAEAASSSSSSEQVAVSTEVSEPLAALANDASSLETQVAPVQDEAPSAPATTDESASPPPPPPAPATDVQPVVDQQPQQQEEVEQAVSEQPSDGASTAGEVDAAAREAIRKLEVELSEAFAALLTARRELEQFQGSAEHALADAMLLLEEGRIGAEKRIEEIQAELVEARTEAENLRLDIHGLRRKFEKDLIREMQEYDEKQTAAFTSRIELEREVLQERKVHDMSTEVEFLKRQAEKQIRERETAMQEQVLQMHAKRMEILQKFFEDVTNHEKQVENAKALHESSVRIFRRGLQAMALRDALRAQTLTGFCEPSLLQQLQQAAQNDELVLAAVSQIPADVFTNGVATDPALLSEYDNVVKKGLERALVREDQGAVLHLLGLVLSKVVRPARGPIEGDEADAVFARGRFALQQGDVDGALRELEQLNPDAREPCLQWMKLARDRASVNSALSVLRARALELLQ